MMYCLIYFNILNKVKILEVYLKRELNYTVHFANH